MASRKKKAKVFKFTRGSMLAVVGVFVVSVAIGSLGASEISRSSQLAVAKEADAKCTPDKDYTYPCGQKNPKTKKIGGKDCPCPDMTNGHETPGKCQGPNICKGEPPGGGKPPEMPKLPEPPKDEKPPEQPKTDTPCPAAESNKFGEQDSAGAIGPDGKPCPNSSLGNTLISNLLGNLTPPNTTDASTTDSETTSKQPFSWFAVGRVIQDAAQNATKAVQSIFSDSNTTLNQNATERKILYPTQETVALQARNTGESSANGNAADQASFYTNPDLNTFGNSAPDAPVPAQPKGFWGGVADALKNFLAIF